VCVREREPSAFSGPYYPPVLCKEGERERKRERERERKREREIERKREREIERKREQVCVCVCV